MVDTLAIYKNLRDAGLNSKQAEAIAQAILLAYLAHSNVAVTKREEVIK
jgi:hypothetical protein